MQQKFTSENGRKGDICIRTSTSGLYILFLNLKKKKIHKTSVVKLSIRDTLTCQQELIKLWRRHCISTPVTDFFLEIAYFKKLTGSLMAAGYCCSIQTSDWMRHSNVGYPGFYNIMCLQEKQSQKYLLYTFFISSFIILVENCSVKACPEKPNQGIIYQQKLGITDRVHKGSGLRLFCLLISPLETERAHPIHTQLPSPHTRRHLSIL